MDETPSKTPLSNTYWVLPDSFLAGEHPADMDENIARQRITALLNAGIRTFVDLTDEDEINEDAKPVPRYRALLRNLAEEQKIEITYLRVPIEDRGIPSVWTMRCLLDVVDRSIADENGVFVHCWAGRGRTGTVVGCYLKRHNLATEQDVIQKIASLRRGMPSGAETSPHTSEQVRMVKHWKQGA